MKGKRIILRILLLLLAAGAFAGWIFWADTALKLTEYRIQDPNLPEGFSGMRIIQVSDLHNTEFGEDNEKLLNLIRRAEPEIIVITGDLVDSRRTDLKLAVAFAEKAVQIAPVYFAPGNHESRLAYGEIRENLTAAGVTVLDNEGIFLERGGSQLALLGVQDPDFGLHPGVEAVLAEMMQRVDGYSILLSHRPELFDTYVQEGVNLVFTGHAHGGQFRLPFVGGLFAPGQGPFPEYDSGIYSALDTTMVVSRGLGNSVIPIRFNNRPDLIVVQLERKPVDEYTE